MLPKSGGCGIGKPRAKAKGKSITGDSVPTRLMIIVQASSLAQESRNCSLSLLCVLAEKSDVGEVSCRSSCG